MLPQIHTMEKCDFFQIYSSISNNFIFCWKYLLSVFPDKETPPKYVYLKGQIISDECFISLNSCSNREGRQTEEKTFLHQRPVMSDLVGPLSISLYLLYVDDFYFLL